MSNSTSNASANTPTPVTPASYANFVRGNYFSLSSRVLFIWEFLVTFDDEVHYIWKGKLTPASVLFIINRYVNLVITILEMMDQAPFQTVQSCGPFVRVLQSLLVVALFIVGAFATLRVYAIWNCDWRPALPVLLLALVSPIVNIIIDANELPEIAPSPSVGCAVYPMMSSDLFSKLTIINRASTTAYDAIVLVLTMARAMTIRRDTLRIRMKDGIMSLLLRDGALYFLVLLFINLTQIIMSSVLTDLQGNNNIAYYVSPITSVLISRFMIDLRKVAAQEERRDPTSIFLTTEIHGLSAFAIDTSAGIGDLGGAVGASFMSPITSDSTSYPDTMDAIGEVHEMQASYKQPEDDFSFDRTQLTDHIRP